VWKVDTPSAVAKVVLLTTNKMDNSWNIYLCKYSTWYVHELSLTPGTSILKDGSFLGPPMYICPCWKLVIKQMIIHDVWKGISTLASKMWTTLAFLWTHWWKPSKSQIQNHHGSQSTALVSVNKKFCNVMYSESNYNCNSSFTFITYFIDLY